MNNIGKLSRLTPQERNAVIEFSTRLKNKFGPLIKEVILFGSKVKGVSKEESDIDILKVVNNLSWEIKKVSQN